MSIENYSQSLKDYAKDIRLNLGSVLTPEGAPGLTQNQIFGIALSCALHTGNQELIDGLKSDAATSLSDAEVNAAKIATTLMAMNNVYYRSIHLAENSDLSKLPAKLRMNGIAQPGISKLDFELYCLAVSAIAGCGMCIKSHIAQAQKAGVTSEGIQSSIRIAAVIQASSTARYID
jgi:alkyl hydroperoxide reductase subunit D